MGVTGTLHSWDDDKGFGFVRPDKGGEDIFVHITSFRRSTHRPQNGDLLIFEVNQSEGKSAATNVRFANGPKADKFGLDAFKQRPIGSLIVGGLVLLQIIFLSKLILFPIIISVITYLIYSKDKAAAQAEKQRTSEKSLHILSLIGGWPGAFVAQTHLHHKLRKPSFMIVYWITVILNAAYLYWFKYRFLASSAGFN